MSKQSDTQGQTTHSEDDKHPHRKKVQIAETDESSLKKSRIGAVRAKKHITIFPMRERRKKLPLSERKQVTIGEFVYKRSKGHLRLEGKWYKLYKGENVADAIRKRGEKEVLVDLLPIEEKEG